MAMLSMQRMLCGSIIKRNEGRLIWFANERPVVFAGHQAQQLLHWCTRTTLA